MTEEQRATDNNDMRAAVVASPTSVTAIMDDHVEAMTLTKAAEEGDPLKLRSSSTPWSVIPASDKSIRTTNPIRKIVDNIFQGIQSGQDRPDRQDPISLALGDPTVAGNLKPCPAAIQAIAATMQSPSCGAGYVNACGTHAARQAVARFHSTLHQKVQMDQVVLASGTSGALELVLTTLLNQSEDSVLLVPKPGFPLYQVIAESHGASVAHYDLLPDQGWECDLNHLEALVASHKHRGRKPAAIVINNPSNPTGAVYSDAHLKAIVRFCQKHRLPVVADEIYGDLTFGNHRFTSMAEMSARCGSIVPVVAVSGLAKQFLLPGWRVGWCVFHDNVYGSLSEVEAGTKRLAQVILGASHLAQTVVPALLQPDNGEINSWRENLRQSAEQLTMSLCGVLESAPGLQVIEPGGAMYAMLLIRTDQFDETVRSDVTFCKRLLEEENVIVLPGSCFGIENAFRVASCAPGHVLTQAAHRIVQFCARHHLNKNNNNNGEDKNTMMK